MIRIYKALSRNLDIEYIDCDIIYYYKNNIAILKRFNFNDIINKNVSNQTIKKETLKDKEIETNISNTQKESKLKNIQNVDLLKVITINHN